MVKKKLIGTGLLVISIGAILWLTLLSRETESHRLYTPFWSYKLIAQGSISMLEEDIKNVLLFVPFGAALKFTSGWKKRYIVIVGLALSILIEGSQWIFRLGSTEFDDVINNTIGAGIGALLTDKKKGSLICGCIVIVLLITIPPVIRTVRMRQMVAFAALNDREDGTKNLLVLNGDAGYVAGIQVTYNSDGSITISGTSDARAWILIGEQELEARKFSFSGMSGVEPRTVAIELEYYNKEKKNFIRLTPDVGPVEETTFEFSEPTRIRAYVGVYPGAEGEWIARPVIYREE